jgi:hypothetical protein
MNRGLMSKEDRGSCRLHFKKLQLIINAWAVEILKMWVEEESEKI